MDMNQSYSIIKRLLICWSYQKCLDMIIGFIMEFDCGYHYMLDGLRC